MLDIRLLRQSPEVIEQQLKRRNSELSLGELVAIDEERREILQKEEALRSRRNELSKLVGEKLKAGEPADELQAETKGIANGIKTLEQDKKDLEARQNELLLTIPNTPDEHAPDGKGEDDNVEVRRWGCEFIERPQPQANGEHKAHWDLGPELGILDFERGVKIAQSRFTALRGAGAALNRGLINFMVNTHTATSAAGQGYEEVAPPYLVNQQAMTGTSQLPKFEDDMFVCRDDALYLIPTAEVPITNLYAGEELAEADLPMQFVAYTPCFRREAGSAGKDTRGLIRQHQFDKVELVKLVTPEQAKAAHQALVADAESILQALELPYRVMDLCAGDMGFAAKRCYDLEVWLPGQQAYREISSCSWFGDFQARRIGLKYRPADGGKLAFCHTINGSGLAVGRTLVAILENYQQADGSVMVPKVLQPYMGGKTLLEPPKSLIAAGAE